MDQAGARVERLRLAGRLWGVHCRWGEFEEGAGVRLEPGATPQGEFFPGGVRGDAEQRFG